jgi:hypothetical protein
MPTRPPSNESHYPPPPNLPTTTTPSFTPRQLNMTQSFSAEDCDQMLHFIATSIRDSMEEIQVAYRLPPGMGFLPGFRVVSIGEYSFLEFILKMDIDPETHFTVHPDIRDIHELEIEEDDKYQSLIDLYTDLMNGIQTRLHPHLLKGRNRYPESFCDMYDFFYNNRIPVLYRLPQGLMQYQPDIPEFTYTAIRDGQFIQQVDFDAQKHRICIHGYPTVRAPL